ncbi:MAG: hypothetical protein M1297_08520 [Nitrospirae bacterium]|jgi:hypothetical protein|nr:hypothetical protein [Nitrospirota bacterium]
MDEGEDIRFPDPDGPVSAARSLGHILEKGAPDEVLAEEETDHALTECLVEIFEEDALALLGEIPSMTPDWSLYIRRFLEAYSEEAEVENPLILPDSPDGSYLYGLGLLVDGLPRLPDTLDTDTCRHVESQIEALFGSPADRGLKVQLHPEWAGIPDLYRFSFAERRIFLESIFPSVSTEELSGFTPREVWRLPGDSGFQKGHPVLREFQDNDEEGSARTLSPQAIVGAIFSRLPPERGNVRERIEQFPDDAGFQSRLSEISGLLFPEARNAGDVSLSIVPWSYLLPMAVSLACVQKIVAFLERVRPRGRETMEIVPFWEKGFLWLHVSLQGATNTGEFLLIDEYVWEFVSELVPTLLESHLPIRTKWHPLPAENRDLSLGVL